MRQLRWWSSVHRLLSFSALVQEGDEFFRISFRHRIPVGAQGSQKGIELREHMLPVFKEQLRPHAGIQPRHPGQIPVASRGEALVFQRGGGFDIGIADNVGHLRGKGDLLL